MKKLEITVLSIMFVLIFVGISVASSSIDLLITAANSGDANAMYELGRAYQNGNGVAKNDTEAAKWFTKAAELNHPRALFSLGYMYDEGIGVKYDSAKSYTYYKKAADLGNPAAMNNLACKYQEGSSGVNNIATQWYEKAIKLGCNEAKQNLRHAGAWRGSRRAEIVENDDEYYPKNANVLKTPLNSTLTPTKTTTEDTIFSHAGFDVAKKTRDNDGYMIISKVAKDSEAEKGGLLEGSDFYQIDNMNTKQFSYGEVAQYIIKSAEKKSTIMIVFMAEDGSTKRLDIKLK